MAVTDAERVQHELEATVVGVSEASLGTSGEAVPNDAFTDALFAAQSTGLDAAEQDVVHPGDASGTTRPPRPRR